MSPQPPAITTTSRARGTSDPGHAKPPPPPPRTSMILVGLGGEPRWWRAVPESEHLRVLGVDDGALLILHEAAGAAPPASDTARTFPVQPATALVAPQRVCERRLSDRTARSPPVKLSRPARCAMALRAAAHNSSRMNRPCRVRRAGPARPGHAHSARTELGAVADSSCLGANRLPAPAGSDHSWRRVCGVASRALRDAPERSQNTCKSFAK